MNEIKNFFEREDYSNQLSAFIKKVKDASQELAYFAAQNSGTPLKYHNEDVKHACEAVENLILSKKIRNDENLRPKGKIFIGLSANEPLIVGIIPVCVALMMGNDVKIRSAGTNRELMMRIVNMLQESGFTQNQISLADQNREAVEEDIKKSNFVFWFGSYKTCKEIGKMCLENDVAFAFEAEGHDISILDNTLSPEDIKHAVNAIGDSLVRHDGQICQSIKGVYVHSDVKDHFLNAFQQMIKNVVVGDSFDLKTEVTKTPVLKHVDTPDYRETPFSSEIWWTEYRDTTVLKESMLTNPYRLSLAVFSRSSKEDISNFANDYKSARLLINDYPERVYLTDPWGGLGKSGTSGPSTWIEKFTDKTFVREGYVFN